MLEDPEPAVTMDPAIEVEWVDEENNDPFSEEQPAVAESAGEQADSDESADEDVSTI